MNQPLTIAQLCMAADNPYEESAKQQGYKGMPDPFTKVFHFEDGSCLKFKVSYEAVSAGRTVEDGR
jgi:hypothetical protein